MSNEQRLDPVQAASLVTRSPVEQWKGVAFGQPIKGKQVLTKFPVWESVTSGLHVPSTHLS